MKTALVTGASGGIGRDIAIKLHSLGYRLILVARGEEKLNELNAMLGGDNEIIPLDLSQRENAVALYERVKGENIEVLINNAGFGVFGRFTQTNIDNELNMLSLNIDALHILMKLFLKDFKQKDKGYILNVASSAAFLPGPLLSSYYASKAYVLRLSLAVIEELRREKSKVKISVLCPGPVKTGFDERAGVSFSLKGLDSKYVAEYAINKMFKGKKVIVPSLSIKVGTFFTRLLPNFILVRIAYNIQHKKES